MSEVNSGSAPQIPQAAESLTPKERQQLNELTGIGTFNLLYSIKLSEAMSAFRKSYEVFRSSRNGYDEEGKLSPKALRDLWARGHMSQAMPNQIAEQLDESVHKYV